MQFSIIITVPTGSNGWSGTVHMPTIQMHAPCILDAIARMSDIVKHTFSMVAI